MKTFKLGGVHPAANKLSDKAPIEVAAVPAMVAIPMAQNLGAPSKAIVAKGDKVKVGTVIGEPGGFLSSFVHSSVSGTVDKVDLVEDATGKKVPAVFIKVEGDEWEESIDRSKDIVREIKLEKQAIIDRVKACGIVGMGGATFPTQVKLTPPPTAKPECVIINAVECEPYLTSDHSLMLAHAEEICIGVQILEKAMGVSKAYIGIEANKPDAIKLMTETAKNGFPEIEIVPLKLKYPQGGEKQLINAVIGKEVPSGGLPIATGALVQNVGTAFAVYEAVQKNKPLIERIVTVTGKSVKKPSNFLARLGVPVADLIAAAGGVPEDTGKIISGGPMMGKAMPDTNSYMVKGCSGILVMKNEEARRKEASPCIRCAKCVHACPMGLQPNFLSKYSELGMLDEAEAERIYDCIECGSCQFSCPANRPLLDWIRQGKPKVMGILRARAAAAAEAKKAAEAAAAEKK
ncbi:MAG: electron transport complex subunit RsxC [Bacteroidales bacterium]|nr:electron transport complex subunit RsxC [Candidatus Liminaster caballi]